MTQNESYIATTPTPPNQPIKSLIFALAFTRMLYFFICSFVCLIVCVHSYYKSNDCIFLKGLTKGGSD